jgi:hypothetical protein
MKELGGCVVVLIAVISYFIAATQFALYQPWPVAHFLLAAVGCGLLVWALMKRSTWWLRTLSASALTFALGLSGLFVWYTLYYSAYEGDYAPPVGTMLGQELGEVQLLSFEDERTHLWTPEERATLLVFYRGHW